MDVQFNCMFVYCLQTVDEMAETLVENGVVDDQTSDADVDATNEVVHCPQENTAELGSEQAIDHSTLSLHPDGTTGLSSTPDDCQKTNSGCLQETSSQCEVSQSHNIAAGQGCVIPSVLT